MVWWQHVTWCQSEYSTAEKYKLWYCCFTTVFSIEGLQCPCTTYLMISSPHFEQICMSSSFNHLTKKWVICIFWSFHTWPSLTTNIALQFLIVLSLWAIVMLVLPSCALSRALKTLLSLSVSRAEVASSSNRTGGFLINARAMAIRCFWPESWKISFAFIALLLLKICVAFLSLQFFVALLLLQFFVALLLLHCFCCIAFVALLLLHCLCCTTFVALLLLHCFCCIAFVALHMFYVLLTSWKLCTLFAYWGFITLKWCYTIGSHIRRMLPEASL